MNETELRRRHCRRRKDAEERRRSALRIVHFALAEELHPDGRRRLLNEALWMATEAEFKHKHKLSVRTLAADAEILKREPRLGSRVRHEHVFPRKWVIEQLLAEPQDADRILRDFAVACVVTIGEASRLKPYDALVGWARYKAAGLSVIEVQLDGTVKERVL